MRFTSKRDYNFVLRLNKELINDIVDVTVVIYKLHQQLTKTNSYGEAPKKTWYPGVVVPCLVYRNDNIQTSDIMTVNIEQAVEFRFLRDECEERNIYPEVGDIIDYNNNYFEIDNINEIQLWAGRPEYNHSIVCSTHLTRNTMVQLEQTTS